LNTERPGFQARALLLFLGLKTFCGVYPRFLDNISDEGLAQDAQAWYKEEVRF